MSTEVSVKLLSHTAHPVETIYAEWQQSRTDDVIQSARQYQLLGATHGRLAAQMEAVFLKVIDMRLPLGETLDFVFLVEGISIALREQLVRHRIGHKMGGRVGADIVPDLAGASSFWSQSMRVMDMGEFVDHANFYVPPTLRASTTGIMDVYADRVIVRTPLEEYVDFLTRCQSTYRRLVAAGIPPEDARMVIPLGATHRMTWKVNLTALQHVLAKRGCWIAQLGLWEPLIRGVVDELAKLHPAFRRLIDPPCFKGGKYGGCVYVLENENRMCGKDPGTPCALWCNQEGPGDFQHCVHESATTDKKHAYELQADRHSHLWGRDARTGEATDAAIPPQA